MSILFKKLRGLKTNSAGNDGIHPIPSDRPENVYTLKKLVFSPRGAMVIFLILAGTGLLSYLTLSWIGSYLDERMNSAIVVRHEPPEHLLGTVVPDPCEPGAIPPESDVPGPPVMDPGMIPDAPKIEPVPEIEIPEFFVRTHRTASMEIPAVPATPEKTPRKAAADNRINIQAKHSDQTPSIYRTDARTPIFRPKIGFTHLQPTGTMDKNRSKPSTSKFTYTSKPAQAERPSAGVPGSLPKGLKTEGQTLTKHKPEPEQIEKRKEAVRLAAIRNARKKRAARVSSLSQLGLDFKQALDRGDNRQAEQVLEQIRGFKGRHNSYYLKLAAFKHIRDAQYQKARQMLEQVLLKHPLDLDAGLNMAVVEIRMGETDLARNRLERLKSIYPGDTRADAILGML